MSEAAGGAPGLSPVSSLRVRIVAAFLAVVAAMLVSVVFLLFQLRGIAHTQALLTEGYLPLALQVDQIRGDQQRIDTDLQRILRQERRPGTGEQSAALVYGERLRENLLEARVHARQAALMSSEPEERAVLHKTQAHLARIEELVKGYQQRSQELVQTYERGDAEGAAALADPLRTDGRVLAEEIEQLSGLLGNRIRALGEASDLARARANTIALATTTVTAVLAMLLLLAVLVALRPIGELTTHVQRLARGDRPGPLDVAGHDEVAMLAREFDRMVEALAVRDRALRERAEQLDRLSRYLASVLDNLEDALFVVEAGVVTLANPRASRAFGVATDAPLPEDLRGWLDGSVRELRRDHAEHEIRAMPFGAGGVIVLAVDVTDLRRASERLARSERLALVGQMLAQITHEVRNPLNALSLNAEMLGDELERLDPARHTEAWALLDTVAGEIERLTEVTAHYLQLARRPRARLDAEDPSLVLAEVERLLQAELDQAGVRMRVEGPRMQAWPMDGNQVRQALLNVVRNAVEAGAHELVLAATEEGDQLRISLRDDGPGMTDEEKARAFDPFWSTKATGTGLGLAITRQILEDHGGSVEIESAPGEGTTIALVLPRDAGDLLEMERADA
ncbi:MAG: HAMP domain-containing protein [Alphaproteobacteria bacterium]|nr:HAMP domain-containing protein [Alphaproteobacteria bacterium]MCB9699041.1 HAMP domain-containing protein [Alphaproteobacteria bacterium]